MLKQKKKTAFYWDKYQPLTLNKKMWINEQFMSLIINGIIYQHLAADGKIWWRYRGQRSFLLTYCCDKLWNNICPPPFFWFPPGVAIKGNDPAAFLKDHPWSRTTKNLNQPIKTKGNMIENLSGWLKRMTVDLVTTEQVWHKKKKPRFRLKYFNWMLHF